MKTSAANVPPAPDCHAFATVPTGPFMGWTRAELLAKLPGVVAAAEAGDPAGGVYSALIRALEWVAPVKSQRLRWDNESETTLLRDAKGDLLLCLNSAAGVSQRWVTFAEALATWAKQSREGADSSSTWGFEAALLEEAAAHAALLAQLVAWIESDEHTLSEGLTAQIRALFPSFMAEGAGTGSADLTDLVSGDHQDTEADATGDAESDAAFDMHAEALRTAYDELVTWAHAESSSMPEELRAVVRKVYPNFRTSNELNRNEQGLIPRDVNPGGIMERADDYADAMEALEKWATSGLVTIPESLPAKIRAAHASFSAAVRAARPATEGAK